MRIPLSLPLAAVALLLAAAGAEASGAPVTELGRRVLGKCDQVVEARVTGVNRAFRGVNTAHLEVVERISGFDRNGTLLLMYIEDFYAPDTMGATLESSSIRYERARRSGLRKYLDDIAAGQLPRDDEVVSTPSPRVETARETTPDTSAGGASGILLAKGERGLFFLTRKGASYTLVGVVSARDPLFAAKRERLLDVMRIESLPTFEERAAAARDFYLTGLADPDPWTRGNSAREILALAQRHPAIFSEGDRVRLSEALFRETEPIIQPTLERAVRRLDPSSATAFAEKAESKERDRFRAELTEEARRLDGTQSPEVRAADLMHAARRYQRASTTLVSGFLADPEPLVREAAAQALAEYGGPSCRQPLREALALETNPDAVMALIYACGVRSDPEAVPQLEARLRQEAFARGAIHALARIGTPSARRALERHRKTADEETARLIDALLVEEFGS